MRTKSKSWSPKKVTKSRSTLKAAWYHRHHHHHHCLSLSKRRLKKTMSSRQFSTQNPLTWTHQSMATIFTTHLHRHRCQDNTQNHPLRSITNRTIIHISTTNPTCMHQIISIKIRASIRTKIISTVMFTIKVAECFHRHLLVLQLHTPLAWLRRRRRHKQATHFKHLWTTNRMNFTSKQQRTFQDRVIYMRTRIISFTSTRHLTTPSTTIPQTWWQTSTTTRRQIIIIKCINSKKNVEQLKNVFSHFACKYFPVKWWNVRNDDDDDRERELKVIKIIIKIMWKKMSIRDSKPLRV